MTEHAWWRGGGGHGAGGIEQYLELGKPLY